MIHGAASGPDGPPTAIDPVIPAKIDARNLNFYYGQNHALKNLNLSIAGNRVTAFIGPSGCGKSTLLRVFNRMYDLYPGQRVEGYVLLDNTNILDPKLDLNLLRARVGMVFQKPTPFPMTIYENIAFGIRLYERLPTSEMDNACGTPVAAFPVTGPIDVIADHPIGVLDMSLRSACIRALSISRKTCRNFALQRSWENSARQFIGNLSASRPSRSLRAAGRLAVQDAAQS